MSQITKILDAVDSGDPSAANQLLPLVYEELRKLAAAKLNHERPDHTLQATALVHEAWLRVVGDGAGEERNWKSRGHFFGAAAEAMRRILIDHARASQAQKRGGDRNRLPLETWNHPIADDPRKLLELDEAIAKFEKIDPSKAALVKMRVFTGLTIKEVAQALDVSTATAERNWAYARAWLQAEMS